MKNKIIFTLASIIAYQNASSLSFFKNEGNAMSAKRTLASIDSANSMPFANNQRPMISECSYTTQKPIDDESFINSINQSSARGQSPKSIAFGFLYDSEMNAAQKKSQFPILATWLQGKLNKNDSLIWAAFAREWVNIDPNGAQKYLEEQDGSNPFLDELSADLQRSDLELNYQAYLDKALSGQSEETNFLGLSTAVGAAYKQHGNEFRGMILQSKKDSTSLATMEDLFTSFYTNLWEDENADATSVVENLIKKESPQDSEVKIILNTGYVSNHDEFLKWFQEFAPKTADSNHSSDFYKQFLAMDEADRDWLLQSPSFRSFENLNKKSQAPLALNSN